MAERILDEATARRLAGRALRQAGIPDTPANRDRAVALWRFRSPTEMSSFVSLIQSVTEGWEGVDTTPAPSTPPSSTPPRAPVGYNPSSGWEVTPDGQWIFRGMPDSAGNPPTSVGVGTTPLGPSIDQAQGDEAMANLLNTLLGGGQLTVEQMLAQLSVMEQLGYIIPEAVGITDPAEFRNLLQNAAREPTLTRELTESQIALAERQASLEEARLQLERLLGTEGLALQRELGYAGFDLQRELAELDAALQRELTQVAADLQRELQGLDADLQRELQANLLAFQREELGFRREQQQFEETMFGFRRSAAPGLVAGRAPSTTTV